MKHPQTPTNTHKHRSLWGLGLSLLLATACSSDVPTGSATDGCGMCPGADLTTCYCPSLATHLPRPLKTYCSNSAVDCEQECEAAWSEEGPPPSPSSERTVPCEDNAGTATCSTWSPRSEITEISGVYYIDYGFFVGVLNDPAPLWDCDSARIDVDDDTLEIVAAQSSDLLYELGFRTGDIPLEINGMPLETFGDAAEAFGVLWLDEGETSYEVKVLRNASEETIDVEVVATL